MSTAENAPALIRSAGRLFRTKGIDGVGVADICKGAGLTHGALYGQFGSKQALAAEALAHGLRRNNARVRAAGRGQSRLTAYAKCFASRWQRDNLADGCAMCASASEIAKDSKVYRSIISKIERPPSAQPM
jgi:TetR/AcrR family transcriptional regulator, transcriptional repressor for nem operon